MKHCCICETNYSDDELLSLPHIDVGFGNTEYWGSVSNHVHLVPVCPNCREELCDGPVKIEETLCDSD